VALQSHTYFLAKKKDFGKIVVMPEKYAWLHDGA
jgi:hypothetical protein